MEERGIPSRRKKFLYPILFLFFFVFLPFILIPIFYRQVREDSARVKSGPYLQMELGIGIKQVVYMFDSAGQLRCFHYWDCFYPCWEEIDCHIYPMPVNNNTLVRPASMPSLESTSTFDAGK